MTTTPGDQLNLDRDQDWERLKAHLTSMAGETVWIQIYPSEASGFIEFAMKTVLPSFAALGSAEAEEPEILSLLFDFGNGDLEIARQLIDLAVIEPDGVMIRGEGLCISILLCLSDDWRIVGVAA